APCINLLHLFAMRRPTSPTLLPYTTLFRSIKLPDSALLIDDRSRKICVALDETTSAGKYRYFVYPAHRILACSIVSDGEEITARSEEHTSELQSRENLVCRLLLEKKKNYWM